MLEQSEGDGDGERRTGFDPRAIYRDEAPGVVTVISLFGGAGLDSILGGGRTTRRAASARASWSRRNGEIATNAHVVTTGEGAEIRRANQVYVEFADGNQVEAKIVGHDPNADIALLKVDPKGLTLRPLPLAESDDVQVGTPVAAIGSPFGEKQSLSVGVVSAIDRAIDSLTDFKISGAIQTDAAINPGNSGGPLVDGRGHVIGVNQQIKSRSGGGEGVGFAVPADVVRALARAACARRARSATPTSASSRCRSTRSSSSASTSRSRRARGCRACRPTGPGRGGRAARRHGRGPLPGPRVLARAATSSPASTTARSATPTTSPRRSSASTRARR